MNSYILKDIGNTVMILRSINQMMVIKTKIGIVNARLELMSIIVRRGCTSRVIRRSFLSKN